jgi:hypothetical protein
MDTSRFGEPRPPKRVRRSESNPLVFLDVTRNGALLGKLVIELFKDVVPKVRCLIINILKMLIKNISLPSTAALLEENPRRAGERG